MSDVLGAIIYGGIIVFMLSCLILGAIWGFEEPKEEADVD